MRRFAAALAAAVVATGCHRSPMQHLIANSRGVCFTEARLCGFAYAPPRPVWRGVAGDEDAASLRLNAAAADVLVNATADDVETRCARAAAYIIRQHPEKAVNELEAVVAVDRRNARSWSDLGAARYETARRSDDVHMYAAALAAAAEALSIDSSLPEARFNHALALDALNLFAPAAESYRRYIAIDSVSAVAAEARERLRHCNSRTEQDAWKRANARLEFAGTTTPPDDAARLVHAFPQQARTWVEGEYLTNWATARLRGDLADAKRWLTAARTIAAVLRAETGEEQLSDSVTAIDRASAAAVHALANAHVAYRRGRILYRDREIEEAIPVLAEAEEQFRSGQSPFAFTARFYVACGVADRGDEGDALAAYDEIGSEIPATYRALAGYIEWQRGNILARNGRPYEALDHTQRAVSVFHELGEMDNEIRMKIHAAALLSFLGRAPDAWIMRRAIFRAVSESGNDVLFEQALNTCARNELQEGRPDIARAILDVELGQPSTSPRLRVDALLARTVAGPTADADFSSLRDAAMKIPANALREEALDDIRLAEAAAVRERNAPLSLQLATSTIDFRTQHTLPITLPTAFLERARAYRRLNRLDAAVADLSRAVDGIEQQRATISRADFRDAYAGLAAEAYQELIDVQVQRGRYDTAFDIAEQVRTRHDLWAAAANQHPLSAAALAAALPRGTIVAEYVAASDRLLIVTLSTAGLRTYETQSVSEIAERGRNFSAAIRERGNAAAGAMGERLFELLIRPLSHDLTSADTLVVVPDDRLEIIPFAALYDRVAKRYLAEEITVTFATSANMYLRVAALPHSRNARRALLISDPAFDVKRFPALPALPAARSDAGALAALYEQSVCLVGADATRSRVTRELASTNVINLAAHAVINERDAWSSVMPLAPADGDSGLLYLHDIATTRLTQAPLVILASCRTAVSGGGRGGVRSLANAFLAAGSRGVVGTLWDVDDSIASEFSRALHAELQRGVAPAQALRAVQVSMMRSSDPALNAPRAWSGFQLYGSNR